MKLQRAQSGRGSTLLVVVLVLVLGTMVSPTIADCQDADIRCQIPLDNIESSTRTTGCEGGASVTGEITGVGVTVDGKCYDSVTLTDQRQYLLVGTIQMGQCYNLFQGGCQPQNCKGAGTTAEACNKNLANCLIQDAQPICSQTHTVQAGEDASIIATSYGITVDTLKAYNPDVADIAVLQINQVLCVSQFYNNTPKCEGEKISG